MVLWLSQHLSVLKQAHDNLDHKEFFTVLHFLQSRFWWLMMNDDIHWFLRTCHKCQVQQFTKLKIPPIILILTFFFARVHVDVMLMPRSSHCRYIVQARDSLIAYSEFRLLLVDKVAHIVKFIFEDVISRWGCVYEIITDNDSSFQTDLPRLLTKYNIHHIRISSYNSRVNDIVERRHLDL